MNYLDYILIVFVIVGFILGFKDGLVRKVIGVIGILLGIFLAFHFSSDLAGYLSPLFNNEIYLSEIVTGFLIFFLTIFIFALLKRVIHPFDKINRFFNQLLGGIAGVVQITFILSAFLILLNVFNVPNQTSRENSFFYEKVSRLLPNTIDLIIGKNYEAQDMIKDYIESKEDSLNKEISE